MQRNTKNLDFKNNSKISGRPVATATPRTTCRLYLNLRYFWRRSRCCGTCSSYTCHHSTWKGNNHLSFWVRMRLYFHSTWKMIILRIRTTNQRNLEQVCLYKPNQIDIQSIPDRHSSAATYSTVYLAFYIEQNNMTIW